MKKNEKPVESWIHRKVPLSSVQVRIERGLKSEMVRASIVLGTSHNRFIEAAISRYLAELKKEGSI